VIIDLLDDRLLDLEHGPPSADITHAVLLCTWFLLLDSSET